MFKLVVKNIIQRFIDLFKQPSRHYSVANFDELKTFIHTHLFFTNTVDFAEPQYS